MTTLRIGSELLTWTTKDFSNGQTRRRSLIPVSRVVNGPAYNEMYTKVIQLNIGTICFLVYFLDWYQGHIHQPYSGPNSKQPNDDGLSRQDCVELRQVYRPQNRLLKYFNRNSSYTWNDRDCSVKNRFLCQTQQHTSLNDYGNVYFILYR